MPWLSGAVGREGAIGCGGAVGRGGAAGMRGAGAIGAFEGLIGGIAPEGALAIGIFAIGVGRRGVGAPPCRINIGLL